MRDVADFSAFVVIYFHDRTFTVGSGVHLNTYLGSSKRLDVFPLRVCAQITAADQLRFAVARGTDPMVPLGTADRGATLTLNPSEVPPSGETGIYIAHAPVGTSAVVDHVTVDDRRSLA